MIKALLVSVNYSDYLEVALPYNTKQFDEIIVLTIKSDKECQDLCSKYSNVKCLVFPDEILNKNGKTFNKGAIINKGFEYLNRIRYSDWLVMTDSDIVFPENFKELMHSKEKDTKVLYGMNRKFCFSLHRFNTYLNTKNKNLCTAFEWDSAFMGYCQIFICNAKKLEYSEDHNAENSDILFLTNFSKEFEQFLSNRNENTFLDDTSDEINSTNNFKLLSEDDFVIHLGRPIENWKGRTTNLFK